MDQVIVRPIRQLDNTKLASIIRNVFVEFDLPKTGTVYDDPATDDLFTLLTIPGAIGLVAEINNLIVGCAAIYPTPGLPEGYCEFSKYYVSPQGRGKGLGKLLLNQSLVKAKEMNYKSVYLESFPGLNSALALYKKTGFKTINTSLGNSGHYACTVWQVLDI